MFGKRILILVPHPDDEVVACAAAIGRARRAGSELFALYLTHGCIAREAMWPWQRKDYEQAVNRRRREAEAAAHFLATKPVGWRQRPARFLWREMEAVSIEVRMAIIAHEIDQLWVPAYEGGNPDHDALNAIGQSFKSCYSVLEFAEYNFLGGKANANQFPYPNGSERWVDLYGEEHEQKKALLAIYASEKANLDYVGTERECFRPLAIYDYNRPPHPGALWYARFRWVPFRHPRVDFSKPKDVSRAITEFLKKNR